MQINITLSMRYYADLNTFATLAVLDRLIHEWDRHK